MAEIGHSIRETLGYVTSSSSSYVDAGTTPENRILGSDLDGTSEYILVVTSGTGGNNTAADDSYLEMEEGGVGQMSESEHRIEPRRTTQQSCLSYGYLNKITTAASPVDYTLRYKSNGTDQATMHGSHMMMIKLDDLAASDWEYAVDDVDDTTMTTTPEDGASVTLGPGDWLVFGFARYLDNGTNNAHITVIDVDGTDRGITQNTAEQATGLRCILTSTSFNVPSGTQVAKMQYSTDTGTQADCLSTRIFALRLDAFEDHAFKTKAKGFSTTSLATETTTKTVDTLTHTSSTAATRDWCVVGQVTQDVSSSQARLQCAIGQGGTEIIGATGTPASGIPEVVIHDGTDESVHLIFGEESAHPDATDLDLDLLARDSDFPGNGEVDESNIVAFTWELAASGAAVRGGLAGPGGLAGEGGLAGRSGGIAG